MKSFCTYSLCSHLINNILTFPALFGWRLRIIEVYREMPSDFSFNSIWDFVVGLCSPLVIALGQHHQIGKKPTVLLYTRTLIAMFVHTAISIVIYTIYQTAYDTFNMPTSYQL